MSLNLGLSLCSAGVKNCARRSPPSVPLLTPNTRGTRRARWESTTQAWTPQWLIARCSWGGSQTDQDPSPLRNHRQRSRWRWGNSKVEQTVTGIENVWDLPKMMGPSMGESVVNKVFAISCVQPNVLDSIKQSHKYRHKPSLEPNLQITVF